MQPAMRHGRRAAGLSSAFTSQANVSRVTTLTFSSSQSIWTCLDCRLKSGRPDGRRISRPSASQTARRTFSSPYRKHEDKTQTPKPTSPTTVGTPTGLGSDGDSAERSLPSHTDRRRWEVSKQMTTFMDVLLARASVAGQHINSYTGTDYSGIEALRTEIMEQEQKVRSCHNAVNHKKDDHSEAFTRQASAQKEIVGLLERKSSWSPTDLEKYMSLVRSEHVNEQTVQAAKDSLALAERELEDARSLLEKLERKQYHEEQIWSDTIRRNSTWITFGLMGFNIVLLLAQITIFEPYRRRKIVRDVKSALDEKTLTAPLAQAPKQVEGVVESAGTPVETLKADTEGTRSPAEQPLDSLFGQEADSSKSPPAAGEALVAEAAAAAGITGSEDEPKASPLRTAGSWEAYKEAFQDLFSERPVEMKQVDITTIALQGAASGVAAMGLLFVLLRPK